MFRRCVLFGLLFLSSASLHASPVFDITSGSVRSGGSFAVSSFAGPGFSVDARIELTTLGGPYRGTSTWQVAFVSAFGDIGDFATVTVDSVGTCVSDSSNHLNCGHIIFTIDPSNPFDPLIGEPYLESRSFTASGHLNIGAGYDITGQGIATLCQTKPSCPAGSPGQPEASFVFQAPEPSSLVLLFVAGLIGAAFLHRANPM